MTPQVMPSPLGTNHENLHLPISMAQDAAPRRGARDWDWSGQVAEILEPLKDKLSAVTLMNVEADLGDYFANLGAADEERDGHKWDPELTDEENKRMMGEDALPQHARSMMATAAAAIRRSQHEKAMEIMPGMARITVLP